MMSRLRRAPFSPPATSPSGHAQLFGRSFERAVPRRRFEGEKRIESSKSKTEVVHVYKTRCLLTGQAASVKPQGFTT